MSENEKKIVKSSLAKENFYKLLHNRLAVLGFILMFVILLACIMAPLLTPYSPTDLNLRHMGKPPGGEHPFGTDKLGRDVFARVLYGGRISIAIGLSGALGGMILGVIIGSFCGYYGGWLDAIFVKIAELVSVFPQLLLVMVMRVILGEGIKNLIIIFVFTGWIATFRLVRGRFFSLREESFVEACRAFGIRSSSIVFRHILPNCAGALRWTDFDSNRFVRCSGRNDSRGNYRELLRILRRLVGRNFRQNSGVGFRISSIALSYGYESNPGRGHKKPDYNICLHGLDSDFPTGSRALLLLA